MNKLQLVALVFVLGFTTQPSVANDHSVISNENIEWGLLNPLRGDASPRAAELWGDRTRDMATGMLVKFKKGFTSPPHIHNVTYRGVVIEGLIHNDDPDAERMWLPTGSFWTQPAGESHVTAANGQDNVVYLEIDRGPYRVLAAEKAFDNGERPINVAERNLVWLDEKDTEWLENDKVRLAHLWGTSKSANGSFVKLLAGFKGTIKNVNELKAVVVSGKATYQWNNEKTKTVLSPSNFFSSDKKGEHKLYADVETILYINSSARYIVK